MKTIFLAALVIFPTLAAAETVTRWTPEQVEAAKEAAAVRNMQEETQIAKRIGNDRGIHGEMGVAIGTGGYRSVFGAAVMPLGQDGTFAFSFENSQNDPRRYFGRR